MHTPTRAVLGMILTAGLTVLAAACGQATAPSSPPTATNVITITPTGVSPKNIVVARGSQVTFVNSDTHVHDMQSDPHPSHDDCPELQQVGFLKPGESRTSGNLNIARTCGFHDSENEISTTLRGTITIQ